MPAEIIINETVELHTVMSRHRTPDLCDYKAYGLKVVQSGQILYQVDDISSSEMDVFRFIARIKNQGVALEQLPYLIEDYVTSLYIQ